MGCQERLGSGVKGQGSDLQHVRQGCVQHNQVREKGAKVGDRAWGQFLWSPELQSLSAVTGPITYHPILWGSCLAPIPNHLTHWGQASWEGVLLLGALGGLLLEGREEQSWGLSDPSLG